MASLLIGIAIAAALFLIGNLTQAIKKLVSTITTLFCRLFRIQNFLLFEKERTVHTSKEFKEQFKEIKVVKKSNQNLRIKRSINYTAMVGFIISVALIIANLAIISGNAISDWIYNDLIAHIPIASTLVTGEEAMNTFYTATMFSILSFSASALITRWKETKEFRKQNRINKAKKLALENMTSKDLVDAAYNKDKEHIERLKKENK